MSVTAYGFEPDFHETIEDPIIQLIMQRDGVSPDYLIGLKTEIFPLAKPIIVHFQPTAAAVLKADPAF